MLPKFHTRHQTRNEELLNGISHGIAFLAAVVSTPFLIIHALQIGTPGFVVGASIFCMTMALLYLASTIYHLLTQGKAKRVFRILDHSSIFLLIAGTYTPFTLGVFSGVLGWSFFGIIWGMATVGITLKIAAKTRHPVFSLAFYLLMGWIIIFAVKPLVELVPPLGITWLVAGGVCYTVGAIFYALDSKIHYGHFIWHLFVMAGTVCHYFAVYNYAA
jgi:hemolysin III